MRKRLLLISPVSNNSLAGNDFCFRLPVLGPLKVAALTPPSWEISIVDQKIETVDLDQEADLVGISTMTATARSGYQIADHFRRRGIKVVMGGMHVSNLPEEARTHCDSVVVGEAECLWPQVLADFDQGQMRPIYRHESGYPALAGQPLSNWDLYREKPYLPVHFVETTRGCPLNCEFCSVTKAFGGRYRNRPIPDVFAELRQLDPFTGRFILKNCVFFVDDNIISNRAYAREFLAQLADLKLRWFSQASMNIANQPELLKLCQRSGCAGLFIGFETLSPETMRSIGKKPNDPKAYLETVRKIHDHGIGIDASFVFGFDTDDAGVFDRTLDFVHEAKIEIPFFSILTPYPGTRLYDRLMKENRLLTRDWSLYDTSHVVFKPKRLQPDQLLDGFLRVIKESFSYTSIVRRLWGTTAWKPFFYPMNFGFHGSAQALQKRRADGPRRDGFARF